MKLNRILLAAGLVLGSALIMFAAPPSKRTYTQSKTFEELKALPADTPIAMVCAKCKSATVYEQGDATTLLAADAKHECPGCKGEITIKHRHKAPNQTELVHTCSKCGDDSAFCCATSTGHGPTKGMEDMKH